MPVFEKIELKINQLSNCFDEISPERKDLLNQFAKYIQTKLKSGFPVNLIFICTHNSRRSHMSQIWAQTAAEFYKISNVYSYSGGTEATAINPRAVVTIQEAGFKIDKRDDSVNPLYHIYYSDESEPIKCFSKVYDDEFNPQKDFAAIMTCSDADENCPIIPGADIRFPIRYNDPKLYDGTEMEKIKYTERFEEIGREILYVFNIIKDQK